MWNGQSVWSKMSRKANARKVSKFIFTLSVRDILYNMKNNSLKHKKDYVSLLVPFRDWITLKQSKEQVSNIWNSQIKKIWIECMQRPKLTVFMQSFSIYSYTISIKSFHSSPLRPQTREKNASFDEKYLQASWLSLACLRYQKSCFLLLSS